MWRSILVRIFSFHSLIRQPSHKQAGVSTLGAVMLAGVGLTTITGTYSILNTRNSQLEILRMQSRLELTEKQLQNSAASYSAMKRTAERLNSSHPLRRCIRDKDCRHSTSTVGSYTLRDAGGQKISGLLDLSGRECQSGCPIRVRTTFQISCGSGLQRCEYPAEVKTEYRIEKSPDAPERYFGGRSFPPKVGSVSLAGFVCDDGEFIVSQSASGELVCDRPKASPFGDSCPPGTAAFGITANGTLKCSDIVDYCEKPVSFSFILDNSFSMFGGKIQAARQAASNLLGDLVQGDQASLVTFNSSASLRSSMTGNIGQVQSTVRTVDVRGFTNMISGLQIGNNQLPPDDTNSNRVVVLLSDGQHNRGGSVKELLGLASNVKGSGVRLFTVGFGSGADRTTLRAMASSPSDFYLAASSSQLAQVFQNIGLRICREN